jgi:hypothetical protein
MEGDMCSDQLEGKFSQWLSRLFRAQVPAKKKSGAKPREHFSFSDAQNHILSKTKVLSRDGGTEGLKGQDWPSFSLSLLLCWQGEFESACEARFGGSSAQAWIVPARDVALQIGTVLGTVFGLN